MIKSAAIALVGAMAFTTAAQVRAPADLMPIPAYAPIEEPAVSGTSGTPAETLAVYYTPLKSTEGARQVGFGMAYHMAIVYTDHTGRSYGVSAIPSNLKTPQTPGNMFNAVFDTADNRPSTFGLLVAEANNNRAFVKNGAGDYYTHDKQGHAYPRSLVMRGTNLSAQWASIVWTYARISKLGLTYSPMTQNSNSMAGTALRRAGIGLDFSSNTYFTPGAFNPLP